MLKLKDLGKTIRNARRKKRLTQKQLGDKVGVSRTLISSIESNSKSSSLLALNNIVESLEVKVTLPLQQIGKEDDALLTGLRTLNSIFKVLDIELTLPQSKGCE